ncbi:efflux RND transporter periplasmic adaptor subunit [Pedobacter sp. HMF7647]|uniref:Efflux RND transporter periplasmic adaptor subunit n=1 Tax=Hufsiella arboris TaxID=2695275 RepID=A0A7K1YET8_9SPHI|nr:efflux RND transporter periplasmic adaptor subunit [Hufsiella arboris]MXV52548.1 efflux RND transporter periplasmic adaptor subunit [Hufsiella arboris]
MKNIIPVLSISASALLLSACGGKDQAKQNPAAAAVSVVTYQVNKQPVTGVDSYPATVVALNEVELRAEVSGTITAIFTQEGQQVRQGQQLYEIDRSKYQAAYNQAKANVAIAQANVDKTQKDAERYNQLARQDAIAKQRVDYAITDLNNAKSQLAAAQALADNAATDLRRSIIKAPFAGTIGLSQVKLGALVTPGTTLLNTISSNDPVAVDLSIGQSEIPRFSKLTSAKNVIADSLFTLQLADKTLYTLPGKIETIDRAVDPQTGTIKVRLRFPNPSHILRAGMTANVNVRNQDHGELITIPNKALTEQMSEFFVFVVNGDSVVQRNVAIGTRVGDKVVIREGLKEGETIVSDGVQNLRQGTKVTQGNAGQQPAGK